MKKSRYLVSAASALSLVISCISPSCLAAAGSTGTSGSTTVTEADFGSAATGSGSVDSGTNGSGYNITPPPANAYDNMGIQQSNTAAGMRISDYYDYYSNADNDSADSQAGVNQTSKNIPIGRGPEDTSRGLPTAGAGLPSTSTGSLAITLANQLNPTGALKIQSAKYNFGFTGKVLPSAYAAARGIALPQVSTGSIIMDTGFTPR